MKDVKTVYLMIDLADSFREGVKIFQKDSFRTKSVSENYWCRVRKVLVKAGSSMYLPINARR